jgi:hypothetical protein
MASLQSDSKQPASAGATAADKDIEVLHMPYLVRLEIKFTVNGRVVSYHQWKPAVATVRTSQGDKEARAGDIASAASFVPDVTIKRFIGSDELKQLATKAVKDVEETTIRYFGPDCAGAQPDASASVKVACDVHAVQIVPLNTVF